MQQPGQTKRALQRVLEVVITRVNGLVIGETTGKTFDGPAENPRHEKRVAVREHRQIRRLHFHFDGGWVFRVGRRKH